MHARLDSIRLQARKYSTTKFINNAFVLPTLLVSYVVHTLRMPTHYLSPISFI